MATKNRGFFSDVSRGADTYFHMMQMAFWTFLRLSTVALAFGMIVATAWIIQFTNPKDRSLAMVRWEAEAKASLHYSGMIRVERNGRMVAASYQDVLSDREISDADKAVSSVILTGLFLGGCVSIFTIIFWIWNSYRRGKKLTEDKLIRGGLLQDASELSATLKRENKASDIRIGPVPMVLDSETRHMLITGSVGAGKSQLMSDILDQIAKRGDCVIIYDKTGDFVTRYYDKNRGDIILNPLDDRSEYWTPFGEIDHPADAVRMAEALYPEPKGNDPYFVLAARAVWVNATLRLCARKGRDIEMLLRYLTVAPVEELAALVDGTDATRYIGTKNSSGDVLAQVAQGLTSFKFLVARQGDNPEFSIRKWVENIDSISDQKPWLFITSRDDWHKALTPLISLWFDCVTSAMLSLTPSHKRRIWLMLDELPTLNNLPSLSPVLAEGRKYGAAGVLGLQNIAQLREIYGKDGADKLMGYCNTNVVFRTPEPTASYMALTLGKSDSEETSETLRYSSASSDDAIQLSGKRADGRPVVLATEITKLPDLTFYLGLPGDYPIVRTKVAYVERPTVAAPYQLAPREHSAWMVMEAAAMAAAKAPPSPETLAAPATATGDSRRDLESVSRDTEDAPRSPEARPRSRDLI